MGGGGKAVAGSARCSERFSLSLQACYGPAAATARGVQPADAQAQGRAQTKLAASSTLPVPAAAPSNLYLAIFGYGHSGRVRCGKSTLDGRALAAMGRSGERRVGEECRSRWS